MICHNMVNVVDIDLVIGVAQLLSILWILRGKPGVRQFCSNQLESPGISLAGQLVGSWLG